MSLTRRRFLGIIGFGPLVARAGVAGSITRRSEVKRTLTVVNTAPGDGVALLRADLIGAPSVRDGMLYARADSSVTNLDISAYPPGQYELRVRNVGIKSFSMRIDLQAEGNHVATMVRIDDIGYSNASLSDQR